MARTAAASAAEELGQTAASSSTIAIPAAIATSVAAKQLAEAKTLRGGLTG
jgi:hypothetical protein